jgi:hypothetical protein
MSVTSPRCAPGLFDGGDDASGVEGTPAPLRECAGQLRKRARMSDVWFAASRPCDEWAGTSHAHHERTKALSFGHPVVLLSVEPSPSPSLPSSLPRSFLSSPLSIHLISSPSLPRSLLPFLSFFPCIHPSISSPFLPPSLPSTLSFHRAHELNAHVRTNVGPHARTNMPTRLQSPYAVPTHQPIDHRMRVTSTGPTTLPTLSRTNVLTSQRAC